jgi:heterodisulfide reductase subunit A
MKKKIGKALVVGAGISGIRSALDLAETGYGVTLIDRSDHLGGVLSQLDYQFPSNACGMCKMLPMMERDASGQYCLRKGLFHENIEVMLSTELASIEGEPGKFQVTVRTGRSAIDPEKCMGCGECAKVCPVEVPDPFNKGLTRRKAVYLPTPHAIPNPFVIDRAACTLCRECENVCPTGAISLEDPDRKNFRVLVVDDELIVRDSIKEWLVEAGFGPDMAESGPEALKKLETQEFDLMLLDIKMPEMDGVEVLRRAKEMRPDLTVVMMTAYATVDTAVEAMKIGALDYLVKPFDPEQMIPMVEKIYQDTKKPGAKVIEVGAVVLAGGTDYFNPAEGPNFYGYGRYPNVVTSLEFERILSRSGPSQGRLIRPSDGKDLKKIAWIQCVGSRNTHTGAEYCSSICCMFALKEAMLAKERGGAEIETAIFYMDLRTFGKDFQEYRDQAEADGVRLIRSRPHSLIPNSQTNGLIMGYADQEGNLLQEEFDMVILSVGAKPSAGVAELCEIVGVEPNEFGFAETLAFAPSGTMADGIYVSGSFTGIKDISQSVIHACSAALAASRKIHSSGGGLAPEAQSSEPNRDVSREPTRTLAVICACGNSLNKGLSSEDLKTLLTDDPAVDRALVVDHLCTAAGWDNLEEEAARLQPNRIVIGACLPYVYNRKIRELADRIGLPHGLIDVVDIRTPASGIDDPEQALRLIHSDMSMAMARIRRAPALLPDGLPVIARALVIGGGIAGMKAALALADHGFPVDLVEKNHPLGGNLNWLATTLEGHSPQELLDETIAAVENHPLIQVRLSTHVVEADGQVGQFHTVIENESGLRETIDHGVTILATGGQEAVTDQYGFEQSDRVITQKEMEQKLAAEEINPSELSTVVMIQCVGSREGDRNYCSRICCPGTLKHASTLMDQNPDLSCWVLYRDMMCPGFSEAAFTKARSKGVKFVPYVKDLKPSVDLTGKTPEVRVFDPVLGRELQIQADLVVLATGINPEQTMPQPKWYGAEIDKHGFFKEAESKWRPVDGAREGVYACGIALAPGTINESIASAEAAAMRALRILNRETLPVDHITAVVRHALCSLCERCVELCPYGARSVDWETSKIVVNPAMCQGCGDCAAVCPNSAAVLSGFEDQRMFETIDAALSAALY